MASFSMNYRRHLLAALLLGVTACGEAPAPAAVQSDDPWIAPLPVSDIQPEPLAADAYHPVAEANIAEAERFLETESVSQISPGEISYFAGRDIVLPDVSRPYLIRAVYRSTRTFSVSIVGNALWVSSGDKPGDTAPVQHQPLVLIMDEVPETVYVTAGASR